MNAQPQSGQVIRNADLLLASGLLTGGSLLLFLSSIALTANRDIRLLVLVPPAIFLHFLGWNALAGWMTVPEGGGPEDPTHLRKRVFGASLAAFLVGLTILLSVYPGSIPREPPVPYFYGLLLIPMVPLAHAPVILVHAGVFWWSSRTWTAVRLRLLVRAAALVLVMIAGIGLFIHLASPGLLFTFLPLAGLTAVGYLLSASGWWAAVH